MTTTMQGLNRRSFIKLVGGGIVIMVSIGPSALLGQERRRGYPEDLNAYLRIDETGHVTIFSGKIEMGQGVMTSQAQMAAEELGVGLDSITMVLGDTDQCPWDAGTYGSLTTRVFGPALRAAAAEGRAVLMQLASKKLGVAKENLVVENGVVSVAGDPSKKVTYGELAQGKQITRLVDEKAVLRSVKEFKLMGASPKRLDGADKVTGRAKYAGDIKLPRMLYARILRPPAHGATLKSADVSAAKQMAGVTVVQQDDLVAVLHATPDGAAEAVAKIKADWTTPALNVDNDSIFAYLLEHAPAADVKLNRGDLAAARSAAAHVFESTYQTAYLAHAPMEPHTAVAELKDGKMTVWSSTQTPFPTRDNVAKTLGLDPKNVRVITPYVGGAFGGKSAGRQALEAARLAKIASVPVQVAWTRQEEFFYDTFNPASVIKVASAVDASGKITMWDYDVYFAGERGTGIFYDIPNAMIRSHSSWGGGGGAPTAHPFAVGPWRAPGANMNIFASESQIDIMAAAAKIDPLEFRLRNTTDARMRRVLQAAADAYGWTAAAGPSGKGRGIACGIDAGTYVALIADVKVDRATGNVKVIRVVCAQDMGIVVNPDGAKMQMEGCITMGLGYPLVEELRFKGGDVLDHNFGTYRLPRFSMLPKIETVLVKNDDLLPQGGGEPAIVSMGAVIANAIFDATGARFYRLPMTPERVLEGIRKVEKKT
jgi:nicotinate dehydrogenase subunit B